MNVANTAMSRASQCNGRNRMQFLCHDMGYEDYNRSFISLVSD
jgi:hypothetical protein